MSKKTRVEDWEAIDANHWIKDNAETAAIAKSEHAYLFEFRKSLKAIQCGKSDKKTEAAKENDAYASPEYQQLLKDIRIASVESLRLQHLMKAAEIQFEHWRTQSANDRKGYQ